jgi:hypothetical protein
MLGFWDFDRRRQFFEVRGLLVARNCLRVEMLTKISAWIDIDRKVLLEKMTVKGCASWRVQRGEREMPKLQSRGYADTGAVKAHVCEDDMCTEMGNEVAISGLACGRETKMACHIALACRG